MDGAKREIDVRETSRSFTLIESIFFLHQDTFAVDFLSAVAEKGRKKP